MQYREPYGSTIGHLDGKPAHLSRNLRGLIDYARRSLPVCVITRKRCAHDRDPGGVLTVVYADGAIGRSQFASHNIMIDWVRNRRSWRAAETRHIDGSLGYLTKPGIIAGK